MATQRSQPQTAAIVSNPKICGGSPTIADTRIRVSDIVYYNREFEGDIEAIREGYPHLTRAQVEAALSYYEAHQAAIDKEMKEEAAFAAEARWRQQHST